MILHHLCIELIKEFIAGLRQTFEDAKTKYTVCLFFPSSFRSITRSYYRNSVGVMIVYDISKRSSFENLKEWYEEAREHIEPHKAIFVILGHKADNDERRQVTHREGKRFAEMHGLKFFETSAKTGQNVEESFAQIARDTYQHLQDGHIRIEPGWDGVKAGFARPKETVQLAEAESDSRCC